MIDRAVIPAAGLGKRLRPLTERVSKEMLPIKDKYVIDYAIQECLDGNVKEIIVIINENRQTLKEYLDRKYSKAVKITYVMQDKPKGLGHAILCAKKYLGDNAFFVILPDEIIVPERNGFNVLDSMRKTYQKYKCSIVVVQKILLEDCFKYAMVIPDSFLTDDLISIRGMMEKPSANKSPSSYAVIGRYLLTSSIFKYLDTLLPTYNNEIQLTNGLDMLSKNEKIYAVLYEEKRYDVGSIDGYRNAKKLIEEKTV